MRIIPTLLINQQKALKGVRFKDHKYLGDPINIIRIFNEKYVDEMVIYNLAKSTDFKKDINYFKMVSDEAFFPISYGGGITTLSDIELTIRSGFERVIINSHQFNYAFLESAIKEFGKSTIILKLDLQKNWIGNFNLRNASLSEKKLIEHLDIIDRLEMSEIILDNVDRDGTMMGLDLTHLDFILKHLKKSNVIISGGISKNENLQKLSSTPGVSGIAAGSRFVFQGKYNSVLINYRF